MYCLKCQTWLYFYICTTSMFGIIRICFKPSRGNPDCLAKAPWPLCPPVIRKFTSKRSCLQRNSPEIPFTANASPSSPIFTLHLPSPPISFQHIICLSEAFTWSCTLRWKMIPKNSLSLQTFTAGSSCEHRKSLTVIFIIACVAKLPVLCTRMWLHRIRQLCT